MKQPKTKNILNMVIIIIFVVIIGIPLLLFNFNTDKILVTENRRTAQKPKIMLDDKISLDIHFINEFNNYINDNIGLKEEAVVFRLIQMYQLFHKVDVPNYMIGKEEHLFYTNREIIRSFQQKDLFTLEQKQRFCTALKSTNDFFESTNAKFYMMTIPNKEEIYPEYYPESIQKYGNHTKIQQLVDYVQKESTIQVFHIRDALLESKGDDLLYYKNYDPTHWNMNGAFVAYKQFMNHLKSDFPQLKIFSKQDFNIIKEKSKGTLQYLSSIESLCKLYNFDDTIYSYHLKEQAKAVDTKGAIPEGVELNNNVVYYHFVNEANANAPKLLIVGDSYIHSFLLPILAESFSEVYFTGITEAERIANLQMTIQADVVLYEFVERAFYYPSYVKEMEKFETMNFNPSSFEYKNLEKKSIQPTLFVDSPSQKIEGELDFNGSSNIIEIVGWALDNFSQNTWGDLYAKVGDEYYKTEKFERPDIAKLDEKYLMCGFSFHIPKQKLLQYDKIEFIVISNDKTYQYDPVKFSIKSN